MITSLRPEATPASSFLPPASDNQSEFVLKSKGGDKRTLTKQQIMGLVG